MLDVPVAEVVLQSPCVVAIIGELKTTGMAQHVWVDRERHLGGLADALDESVKTDGADWPAALGNEYVSLFRVLAAQLPEGLHLVTPYGMHAGKAVLAAVNRADRRPASWSRRDARSGHACGRSPSAARPRAR